MCVNSNQNNLPEDRGKLNIFIKDISCTKRCFIVPSVPSAGRGASERDSERSARAEQKI